MTAPTLITDPHDATATLGPPAPGYGVFLAPNEPTTVIGAGAPVLLQEGTYVLTVDHLGRWCFVGSGISYDDGGRTETRHRT